MLTLDHFPRVALAHRPTPLEKLQRLSDHLGGPEIWIKRDDCTGLSTGGNKARKLEFLIGEALAKGCKAVATLGATQSNHARQTAAAAAKYGLDCYLMLENSNGFTSPDYNNNGNVLLDHLHGAIVGNCPPGANAQEALDCFAEKQRYADATFFMPLGGSSPRGALGYVSAAIEIAEQMAQEDIRFDGLVHATGSGGTQAGLIVGFAALGKALPVHGVSVKADEADMRATVQGLISETIELLSLNASSVPNSVLVSDECLGAGYGVPSDEGTEALQRLARIEGILLDPVYTSKAMAWLIDAIRAGVFTSGQRILFLHTGGSSGMFGYSTDHLAVSRAPAFGFE